METDKSNNKLPDDDFSNIYQRLKAACGVHTDKEFAEVLGIKRQAITVARKRGSVPSNWLITIADNYAVSLDWLRYGIYPEWTLDATLQIERLKRICDVKTDEQFANLLKVTKKTIESIRETNESIPHSWYYKIAKETNVSLKRLWYGYGSKHITDFDRKLINFSLEREEILSSIDISPINEKWIKEIVVRIEDRLKEMNCSLSPEGKASVISASYESFWYENKKKVDLKYVDACVRTAVNSERDVIKK